LLLLLVVVVVVRVVVVAVKLIVVVAAVVARWEFERPNMKCCEQREWKYIPGNISDFHHRPAGRRCMVTATGELQAHTYHTVYKSRWSATCRHDKSHTMMDVSIDANA
jgi:hypothetical protein